MEVLHSFNVSFYERQPSGLCQIFKLQDSVLDRLRLYTIFKNNENLDVETFKLKLKDSPLKQLLEGTEMNSNIQEVREMDYVSHWTLRIAYSTQHPMFFIDNERKWFQFRWECMSLKSKEDFIKAEQLNLVVATREEKMAISLSTIDEIYYKIYWTEVPDLLKNRLALVHKGICYVTQEQLVFFLTRKFEELLKETLKFIKKRPYSERECQLDSLLSSMDLVLPYNSLSNRPLSLSQLPKQSERFPLCMKHQYNTLLETNHLRYPSRLEFGTFLRDCGLALNEALEMWKSHFEQNPEKTPARINKYMYYFKHLYGTVGSKTLARAHCCKTVINEDVKQGQVNGCPFKLWDNKTLSSILQENGLNERDTNEVLSKRRGEKYMEACTYYFECKHKCTLDSLIDHPNLFYEKSCKLQDIEDLCEPFQD